MITTRVYMKLSRRVYIEGDHILRQHPPRADADLRVDVAETMKNHEGGEVVEDLNDCIAKFVASIHLLQLSHTSSLGTELYIIHILQ